MACGLEFGSLLCFLSASNPLFMWLVCPDAPYSRDERCALLIVILTMRFQSTSPSSGAFFSFMIGTAPHFPSLTMWAQSRQCPNYRLHGLFSLMILLPVLLSRDEEKWDNCAIKHLFSSPVFFSGASLWCVNYSTLQRTVFGTQECCKRIILRWLVFLLLGYHGGCVVLRGGSSFGRWEVKNCSDFKAMSLCKTPIKVWVKTEFEGRWPFHPCYMDWESETGLASCFKVMSKLSAYSFGSCISPFIYFILSFLSQCLVHSICSVLSTAPPVFIIQIILSFF